ncbi:glycoside hydrolase [Delitschia confertaspora ATCC 74209]|uniref:Probable beta-glucosidase btgE n=1 Tax=Delitschia confertaspora ATCC 74209 TaxID=1513339 RepID=A0A9P4JNN5_9PLEO|nr:glycoside hydrolase [Delitschia confertaspora ATCC 74209]
MKGAVFAASAASLLGSAVAGHARHQAMHLRRGTGGYAYPTGGQYEEVCSVYTTTITGEGGLVPAPTAPAVNTSVVVPVSPVPTPVEVSTSYVVPYPTADVSTCETPGTYTFPAKTTTVSQTTTVCGPTTTVVPSGTHTYGGVTTSVVTATTIVCPYATEKTEGGVKTSVIETTTYVCPSGGEYTIAPTTTYVSESTTLVYPTISVFVPGTYTHPAKTVTVTKTSEVYVCPYETSKVPEAPKPTSEAPKPTTPAYSAPAYEAPAPSPAPSKEETPKVPVVSGEVPAPSAPAYSAPAYSAPVPSKPVVSAAPKPSNTPTTPSYNGGGRVVTKGNKWAMTYTPYTAGGQCKTKMEVESDIAAIAKMGFTTIRSYSTDCGVFENVAPACSAHGLKMIVGIFFEKGGKGPFSDYADKQLQEIKNKAPKDMIVMVIVGNEALFNNVCEAEELGAYIDHVRQELQGAGFPKDIAITTTEPVDVWENKGAALCSHIDIFACQVHPFFTSKVDASMAGDFAVEQLEKAAAVCPEAAKKGKFITEIGWPSQGEANGNAIPGYSQQKTAIKSILEKVGKESCLFSFQNDSWKPYGAFGVERYFGCKDAL